MKCAQQYLAVKNHEKSVQQGDGSWGSTLEQAAVTAQVTGRQAPYKAMSA